MECPTTNRPAYRYMVRDHKGDEIAAMKEWMNNNHSIPQQYLDEEALYYSQEGMVKVKDEPPYISPQRLRDREAVLNQAIALTSKKVNSLSRLVKPTNNVQSVINELTSVLTKMKDYSSDKALLEFIKAADIINNSTYLWVERLYSGQELVTLDKLIKIKEFNDSTELLEKITSDYFEGDIFEGYSDIVKNIIQKRSQTHERYIHLSRRTIAELWAPHFEKLREREKREAELRFNFSDYKKKLVEQKKSKREIESEKEKYIKDELLKVEPLIKTKTIQYFESLLTNTEDIGGVSSFLVNPKDMGNDIVSMAVEAADLSDWQVMQDTNKATSEMKKLLDNFYKQVGKKNNPADQYELFLTTDENGFPRIAGEAHDKVKLIRTKYKGTAVEELYDFMAKLIKEKDAMVPVFAKLGYGLPRANKKSMERVYSNGIWSMMKEGVVDIYKLRALDLDFGDIDARMQGKKNAQTVETLAKESNQKAQYVPIFFRGKIEESEQSLDLPSLLIMDYQNSLNFKRKTELFVMLDVLRDTVGEASVLQRSNVKSLLQLAGGQFVTDTNQGASSNLYKVLEHLIDHRVFGKNLKGDPKSAKVLNKIKSYTSNVSLILNRFSPPANFLQGQAMNWIETVGGSTGDYTAKNRAKASFKYDIDIFNIMKDIGEEVPTSKTNLLMELFDASSDWHGLDKGFVQNNKIKRLLNVRTLYGIQGYTEHAIQSVAMYSILDNIKVLDTTGSYLDGSFNPTDDRNKAMSLDEAYSVVDGKLELDSRVASTEKTENVDINDGLFQVSRRIQRTNRKLYGNYSSKNKSQFDRTMLGNLIMHMRGWMITGIQYHWKGIGKRYIKPLSEEELKELSPKDREAYEMNMMQNLNFNTETNKFEEGIYTSVINVIKRLYTTYKETKALSLSDNWKTFTKLEKRNMLKAAVEIAILLSALMLSSMLMAGGDDEGEVTDDATLLYNATLLYGAYVSRRLYSELSTFFNVFEAQRTVRSPAISLNSFENLVEFFVQGVTGPTERYEKGDRKETLKIKHKFFKLIPVASQLERSTIDALTFLTR